MNFNQWYIFHFVQWPFAIFLVTSWFHAYRTSGPYRQKTESSAISQLHHHWKFYHSRGSVKIEINSNLMVQDQGYIVDVTLLPNQALIIFGEWLKMCVWCSVIMVKHYTFTINQFWPFFFDRCVQFVQLTTVDIWINCLVTWKQLRKYHTFQIPPNRQHYHFFMQFSFRCCLWLFITLGPWSSSNDLTNPFFITSDHSFQKKRSNSLRLR